MRTLLIFIALAVIVAIGKRLLGKPRSAKRTHSKPGNMVQCAQCGVFVPENEAFERDGRRYCSREHRDESHEQT